MENSVKIHKHINMVDEAFFLLYQWVNTDSFESIKAEFANNYVSEIDNYNSKFDLIIEMYNFVKTNLASKKERIDYYFRERNTDMSTYGVLALFMDLYDHDHKLLTYQKFAKTITEEEKIKRFANIIDSAEAVNTAKEELKTLSDLIAFIEASPYEKEAKWEAIKIYNNTKPYYNEMHDIIKETIDLLNNKFGEQIADIENEFYLYWTKHQKSIDIMDNISKKLSVTWSQNNLGTIVMPVLFLPMSVTITIRGPEAKDKMDIIRMSVLIDNRFALRSSKVKKEDVINIGKLLCDKSKVDILEYVSKKPAYGKEIANELNLSTATISYHVNALIKVGFLKESVSANRLYYSINQPRIASCLDAMKEYFNSL